jgi:hypothetical protein
MSEEYPGRPPQPPQQPPQQPQQWQQQPPPKKKHTVRNVFIVLAALFVLGIAGCVAFLGAVGNEMADEADKQEDRAAPRAVTVGTAFDLGKHQTLAGWTVKNDAGMFNVTGKVKNISDTTSTSFIHFKFLDAKGEVLGNVQCNSADLEPGQTQALNCIPDGTYGKYAKVTAEATF